MKKLESTFIKDCRGIDVEITTGESVDFINENNLKKFGIDPSARLPKKYENCGSGTYGFLYEHWRKFISKQYGIGPYKILEIIERESKHTAHVHEILYLNGPKGNFEFCKGFFYKCSNHLDYKGF
jgi:hypothetical protein